MPKPRENACKDCAFWMKPSQTQSGRFPERPTPNRNDDAPRECRRHAPIATPLFRSIDGQPDFAEQYWPKTSPTDWCGDFEHD